MISIIIPTFNREKILKTALDSVLAQTNTNWECIVVDDGSVDHTLDLLLSYQKKDTRFRFFVRNREPKGAPTCRNIGLKHAKGEYVIFLDSDDYLLPFCLEQRERAIRENPDCSFLVFPMGELYNETIVKKEIPYSDDYLHNFLSALLPWSIMCPLWRTAFLKEIQGFKEGYPRFNDPELMIRALLTENVNYKVFKEMHYDCVLVPSLKESKLFLKKVYQSLLLFIPDCTANLELKEKTQLKPQLAGYLHLWFKYFYVPAEDGKMRQSYRLIYMFQKYGVISKFKSRNLTLRLLVFVMSRHLLKMPINKLTEKTLYLN